MFCINLKQDIGKLESLELMFSENELSFKYNEIHEKYYFDTMSKICLQIRNKKACSIIIYVDNMKKVFSIKGFKEMELIKSKLLSKVPKDKIQYSKWLHR